MRAVPRTTTLSSAASINSDDTEMPATSDFSVLLEEESLFLMASVVSEDETCFLTALLLIDDLSALVFTGEDCEKSEAGGALDDAFESLTGTDSAAFTSRFELAEAAVRG